MSRPDPGGPVARAPDPMRLVKAGDQPARPPQPARAPSGRGVLSGWAELPLLQVLRQLESSPRGLAEDDAQERLATAGENTPVAGPPPGRAAQLVRAARDPSSCC